MDIELSKITDVEIEDINTNDYPKFCDAFLSKGYYIDRDLTELEIDYINEFHSEFIHEQIFENQLY